MLAFGGWANVVSAVAVRAEHILAGLIVRRVTASALRNDPGFARRRKYRAGRGAIVTPPALAAMLALGGCFIDASTGVQAPTRHGYGNWGIPLSVTVGGDAQTRYGRIGGGGDAHVFVSPNSSEPDSLGWAAGGLQVRNELALVPLWRRMRDTGARYYHQQIVLVTTLSAGLGGGRSYRDDQLSRATYIDAYVGAGVSDQRGTKRERWWTWSTGVAATRIWLGDRDPAWFVGVAATLGLGLED